MPIKSYLLEWALSHAEKEEYDSVNIEPKEDPESDNQIVTR